MIYDIAQYSNFHLKSPSSLVCLFNRDCSKYGNQLKSVSQESLHFSNSMEIFSHHQKIIITIFKWMELKFATQVTIIETCYQPCYFSKKLSRKSTKQLRYMLSMHKKFFYINSEQFCIKKSSTMKVWLMNDLLFSKILSKQSDTVSCFLDKRQF